MIDPGLREYATEAEARILDALSEHGTIRKAATALGCARGNVSGALGRARRRAAKQGYSPGHGLTHGVAPGFGLDGYSHLTKTEEGEPIWLKAKADQARKVFAAEEAAKALSEGIPRESPVKPPQVTESDLMVQYTISDFHLGLLSWAPETGGDWDTEIAEDMLTRWFSAAIAMAPKAHTAVFAQLGDIVHYDSLLAVTPNSGHHLDADTRFAGVVRVAMRAAGRIVHQLLTKHQEVHVIMCEGNHDESSSVWLREHLSALFSGEPRVTVDTSPKPFNAFEWGKTSLFYHHGHKVKIGDLAGVFASEFRELYGRTEYSYGHCGHYHRREAKEGGMMHIERHPTLATRDAYAARGGFDAKRGATYIEYSREFGELGRKTIPAEMVRPEMVSTPSR